MLLPYIFSSRRLTGVFRLVVVCVRRNGGCVLCEEVDQDQLDSREKTGGKVA